MARKAAMLLVLAAAMAGCGARYDRMPAGVGPIDRDAQALDDAVAAITQAKYPEASAQLAMLVARFEATKDRQHQAESLFWLAYCYEKLGRTGEAARLYGRIVQEHPYQPAARQAAERLSRIPDGERL